MAKKMESFVFSMAALATATVIGSCDRKKDREPPPGLTWISIPGGSFEMGCSPGDSECTSEEEPRHSVNVPAFFMTETEITQEQFEAVTGDNPSYIYDCPSCPVERVTWNEARAFCEAIGGRLPSEAEWEYAGRAGTTTRYYCGDDASCLDDVAWYDGNSDRATHPVRGKTPNAFGLYDMLGNIWEWVEDCYHADYEGAPSGGEVWAGGDCHYHVLHGGSWAETTRGTRVSARAWFPTDVLDGTVGLRCVK